MKLNMKYSFAQLMNLPDEILMIILKKLNNVEVLYSLIGVNIRLDQIVHDPVFTTQLALMEYNPSTDLPSPLPDAVLDRFCLEILNQICNRIKWFNLETLSMERILLAANYPNLSQLDIFIMNEKIDIDLFTNKSALVQIFQNQITKLSISVRYDEFSKITRGNFFSTILLMFTNVRHLKFLKSNIGTSYISFNHQFPTFFSSTLVELHVGVDEFDDCLYLLDGRLSQLRILFVKLLYILPLRSANNNKEKLPNLKHFSLTCITETFVYDELLKLHLHRMSNLEKLALYLGIDCDEIFIDGNNLKQNIINYMPRLKEFIFNIRSEMSISGLIDLPSKEDIQHTFLSFENYKVISCVDYFPNDRRGQCHIYSHPYTLTYYYNITNNFPGGIFNCVQEVTLFDECPFEHEFFIRISQSFPFLEDLTIQNLKPQHQKSNDKNEELTIIEYPHLNELHLFHVHDDYVEQFLLNSKTCLRNDIRLIMNYNV